MADIDGARYSYHTYELKRQVKLSRVFRKKRLFYIAFCSIFLIVIYPYVNYPWAAAAALVAVSLAYGFYRYVRAAQVLRCSETFLIDLVDYLLIACMIYLTGGLNSIFFIAYIVPVLAATIRFSIREGLYGFGLAIALTGLNALIYNFGQDLHLPVIYKLLFGLGTMIFAAWSISDLIGDEQELRKELYRFSVTDPLTGLFHFGYASERIGEEIRRCRRDGSLFSIIFIDLDRFKEVNDRYGHLTGNDVIRHIAAVLRSVLRGGDMLSRHGGDEFLMLLPGAGLEEAELTLKRLLRTLQAQPYYINGAPLHVSFSGGTAEYPAEGENLEQLLQVADEKMYRKKRRGSGEPQFMPSQNLKGNSN